MPNKIKSSKQFRFLEGIANGMKSDKAGLNRKIASKILDDEDDSRKKKFAKSKR